MNNTAEKVIFRTEKDKENNRINYMAVFPDDPCNPGRIAFISFYKIGEGEYIFEPYGEMSRDYYYSKTRVVHISPKTTELLEVLMSYINNHNIYGYPVDYDSFKVMEKITY